MDNRIQKKSILKKIIKDGKGGPTLGKPLGLYGKLRKKTSDVSGPAPMFPPLHTTPMWGTEENPVPPRLRSLPKK